MYTDLKGDETQRHHTEPYHRQGVFTSEETRIEETNTRDHYPDESRRSNDPCDVAIVVYHGCIGCWIGPDDVTRWGGRSVILW